MRVLSFFLLLVIIFFTNGAFADIRKNKLIQDTVKMSVQNGRYCFEIHNLLKCKEALEAFTVILEERYKKEHLNGILVCTKDAQLYYNIVANKLAIPLIYIDLNNPSLVLTKNGRYIAGETVLEEGYNMENLLKFCEKSQAFIMEIVCITEVLHLKARENLNAQIMSIFINRATQKAPSKQ